MGLVSAFKVLDAHGIRGLLKVQSFVHDFKDYSLQGFSCDLDEQKEYRIDIKFRLKPQVYVIKLDGLEDRNQAETLRGRVFKVKRETLPEVVNEKEFYFYDLVDLNVLDNSGNVSGKVKAVHNFGAGDIIELDFVDDQMFAFNEQNFPEVNLAEGFIKFNRPENSA